MCYILCLFSALSRRVDAKLQALVYDILPWRKVPENDAGSVGRRFVNFHYYYYFSFFQESLIFAIMSLGVSFQFFVVQPTWIIIPVCLVFLCMPMITLWRGSSLRNILLFLLCVFICLVFRDVLVSLNFLRPSCPWSFCRTYRLYGLSPPTDGEKTQLEGERRGR